MEKLESVPNYVDSTTSRLQIHKPFFVYHLLVPFFYLLLIDKIAPNFEAEERIKSAIQWSVFFSKVAQMPLKREKMCKYLSNCMGFITKFLEMLRYCYFLERETIRLCGEYYKMLETYQERAIMSLSPASTRRLITVLAIYIEISELGPKIEASDLPPFCQSLESFMHKQQLTHQGNVIVNSIYSGCIRIKKFKDSTFLAEKYSLCPRLHSSLLGMRVQSRFRMGAGGQELGDKSKSSALVKGQRQEAQKGSRGDERKVIAIH
ncbi:hypothetical protein P5673_002490 [Acropora cervicornis]|uniref:Uncharacterized protein n=1 Tax=Acropora cervicornis TaxID=6130 RepID=A0AAD9R3W2_ACRCE|nr:hypothetical protein P5673_002490 [Acropora cervicornis]